MEQEQSPELGQNKWNSVWPILLTVVITAIIVGGGVYWWQNSVSEQEVLDTTQIQSAQTDTEQVNVQEEEKDVATAPAKLVNTAITGTAIEQSYSFSHGEPEGFTSLSRGNIIFMAKKAMARLYENEENITSFYTPEHPTNSDIIFISTSGDITGEWPDTIKSTNKIYSYDIKTDEVTELYEEHENRLLRTMGMDGSKLVLMYDLIDNSPGPCFSVWADWESFGYLELADINSGLRPYTVPSYQVEIGKAEQEKCIEEMGF